MLLEIEVYVHIVHELRIADLIIFPFIHRIEEVPELVRQQSNADLLKERLQLIERYISRFIEIDSLCIRKSKGEFINPLGKSVLSYVKCFHQRHTARFYGLIHLDHQRDFPVHVIKLPRFLLSVWYSLRAF